MLKAKRLAAKIIDYIIFMASGVIVATFFLWIIGLLLIKILGVDSTFITTIKTISTISIDELNALIDANKIYLSAGVIVVYTVLTIYGYIYFGLIGKLLCGSPGKYVLRIFVEDVQESTKKVTATRLFLREPLIHTFIITIIFAILSLFMFGFLMVGSTGTYLYIIFFLVNFDFWNKILKLKII